MSIRMSRSVVVDGIEHFIIAEGGSGKECMAIIAAIADEVGAAPMPATTSTARGRGRPPKAPAAPAAEPKPPAGPPTAPAAAGSVFGPAAQRTLIDEIRDAEAADAPVTWSDEPPVAVDEHSVELEAPPSFDEPPSPESPPASEEDELRTLLAGIYDGLRSRVPATWHTACATAYQKAIAENGGDLFAMTAGQLRKAMAAIDAYAAKCDQAMQVKH